MYRGSKPNSLDHRYGTPIIQYKKDITLYKLHQVYVEPNPIYIAFFIDVHIFLCKKRRAMAVNGKEGNNKGMHLERVLDKVGFVQVFKI